MQGHWQVDNIDQMKGYTASIVLLYNVPFNPVYCHKQHPYDLITTHYLPKLKLFSKCICVPAQ